jgi:hypothetical protein
MHNHVLECVDLLGRATALDFDPDGAGMERARALMDEAGRSEFARQIGKAALAPGLAEDTDRILLALISLLTDPTNPASYPLHRLMVSMQAGPVVPPNANTPIPYVWKPEFDRVRTALGLDARPMADSVADAALPIGIGELTGEIERVTVPPSLNADTIRDRYGIERMHDSPTYLSGTTTWPKSHARFYEASDALLELCRAGYLTSCEGVVVPEVSFGPLPYLRTLPPNASVHRVDRPAVNMICGIGAGNYCHMLLDTMIRLLYLDAETVKGRVLICDQAGEAIYRKMFAFFGIRNECLFVNRKQTLACSNLLVCDNVPHHCNGLDPALYRKFQEPLSSTQIPDKRLFIDRRGQHRSIVRDADFDDLLDRYGFETAYMEDLSLAEQAELFHRSNVILAPHGAGLSNLVFAQPGYRLFEIFPGAYSTPTFALITGGGGGEHIIVPAGPIAERRDFSQQKQPIELTTPDVREWLEAYL